MIADPTLFDAPRRTERVTGPTAAAVLGHLDSPHAVGPAARLTDPETSTTAAARVKGGDRRAALVALVEHGPMTDFELADRLGRQQTSAGKRRGELVTLGLAEWSREHRPAPSGSAARVWAATAAGRKALR